MPEKTKILHLIPRFSFGGAENLVLEYARLFDPEKYEVKVVAVRPNKDKNTAMMQYFKDVGVEVFAVSCAEHGGVWWQWGALRKFVKDYNPDIIHSHIFSGDIYGFCLRRLVAPRAKWISTQHNIELNTRWWRRLAWNMILPQADRVIAVSEEVKKYTSENFGVLKDKLELLPNGISLEKWLAVPDLKFMKNGELRLATIGRLETQKGHRYLVEALAQLKDLKWHWDIYGDGSLEIYLKEKIKKGGLQERVSWYQSGGGMDQKIKDADMIVQPSLWEGMSLVIMEAMASGKLLITTTVAGEELVVHGENGYLVPAKDVQELARTIKYYYEHADEAERLAHSARQYARTHFDLKDNLAGLEEIYGEVLN